MILAPCPLNIHYPACPICVVDRLCVLNRRIHELQCCCLACLSSVALLVRAQIVVSNQSLAVSPTPGRQVAAICGLSWPFAPTPGCIPARPISPCLIPRCHAGQIRGTTGLHMLLIALLLLLINSSGVHCCFGSEIVLKQ
jgi:hypothetical protein